MASTNTATHPEPGKVVEKAAQPPEMRAPAEKPVSGLFGLGDVVLRFLLFASSLVAVILLVTSKQAKLIPIPIPPYLIPRTAKFTQAPALIYYIAAVSIAGFYGIITTFVSLYALLKPGRYPRVVSNFVIFDVLLLGIVAAAVGAAGAMGYTALKGNSHVQWTKICNRYDYFCRHISASISVSLFGSIVLTLLILLSIYSLSKRIPKQTY
ncbi:CASP-like protein IN26 [Sesamum alatum]|uniref:CASP-like protein n=1 Tax=Sesamum alatum TaxID=300844 RepID=A0AAE1YSG0_9LAMI|nr:CASP-like protein IN26 [Sesamum alatum]